MELSGTTVLVTGASRGIGRAVAELLAERGARVHVAARDEAALREVPGAAGVHRADLSDPAEALALAEEVGAVDVLVNNAGVRVDGAVAEVGLEALDHAFQVNALSPFVLAGALGPGAQAVVNVVAPAVAGGHKGLGAYAASKAAMASMSTTLRQELRRHGVQVVAFDPGLVRTGLNPQGTDEPRAAAERLVAELEAL